MTPDPVPYGLWRSPISAEQVAAASTTFDELQSGQGRLLWLEGRPDEGGRSALVVWDGEHAPRDVLPAWTNVGSAVYGYGGGAFAAARGQIWFSDSSDGQLWLSTNGGPPTPQTTDSSARFADLHATPIGLLCVREHERTGRSDIVLLDGTGVRSLTSGTDLYTHPRLSVDRRWLAWLSWPEDRMPWDSTYLWAADAHSPGIDATLIAGGENESVLQPTWTPDGCLYFLSDRTGWWNLYRHRSGTVEPVMLAEAEMGAAPWEAGYSTYTFLSGDRIAVLLQNGPEHRLVLHHLTTGRSEQVRLPYRSIKPYLVSDGQRLGFIGSGPTQSPTVATLDPTNGRLQQLAGAGLALPAEYVPEPEEVRIPARDKATLQGLLHHPLNPTAQAPPGDKPPLIVRVHPGPTANTTLRLDPATVYFTSRGFALLDIDYRGSTGYGRAYRKALDHRWGILDVEDVIDAAEHHIATGDVDPNAIFISGASAGGYTALRALARTRLFAGGTARSAIADLTDWRQNVPRLQRHHADQLVGPWPDAKADYLDRSLLHNVRQLEQPVLLLHGQRDNIAELQPIVELAAELTAQRRRVSLLVFPDEGHYLRSASAIAGALDAEYAHYQTHLLAPGSRSSGDWL